MQHFEKKMDFSKIDLFEGIRGEDAERMMSCFGASFRRFRAGSEICDYSGSGDDVGIMLGGDAAMIRTDEDGEIAVMELFSEGDIFGEVLAFSNDAGDSVKVVAEIDCEVMFIKYAAITKRCERACEHHSRLVSNMFGLIAKKTLSLSRRIEILSKKTTREKLMYYFGILAKNCGREFDLPMSVTRLAAYICADRSAMTRELSRMQADGLIEMEKRRVRLKKAV